MKNIETDTALTDRKKIKRKQKVQTAFRLNGWAYAEPFLDAVDKYNLTESALLRMFVEEAWAPVIERLENKRKATNGILERTKVVISSRWRLQNKQLSFQ